MVGSMTPEGFLDAVLNGPFNLDNIPDAVRDGVIEWKPETDPLEPAYRGPPLPKQGDYQLTPQGLDLVVSNSPQVKHYLYGHWMYPNDPHSGARL